MDDCTLLSSFLSVFVDFGGASALTHGHFSLAVLLPLPLSTQRPSITIYTARSSVFPQCPRRRNLEIHLLCALDETSWVFCLVCLKGHFGSYFEGERFVETKLG